MRLGVRLMLAFLVVAFVPAGTILAFTWLTVEERFHAEYQDRLNGVAEEISTNLQVKGKLLQRKVREIADSELMEQILVDMVQGKLDRQAMVHEAAEWMRTWDLDVLSLMDGTGLVLSSGHLPARSGNRDETLFSLATQQPMTTFVGKVQVLRGGNIDEILAVMVGTARRFGQVGLLVVGGKLLDEGFVEELERLSGASICIVDAWGERLTDDGMSGDAKATTREEQGINSRNIPLLPREETSPSAYVVASVSDRKLVEARQRIVMASATAAVVGVFISWLLGLLVSRRILKPVYGLVRGARLVATGDLDQRVEFSSSGEIGELVRAFNRMTKDLAAYRTRLVRAERIAAWQEIARRLAHEIKNPLSPIQMSIETLRKAYASRPSRFSGDLRRIHPSDTRGSGSFEANCYRVFSIRSPAQTEYAGARSQQGSGKRYPSIPR